MKRIWPRPGRVVAPTGAQMSMAAEVEGGVAGGKEGEFHERRDTSQRREPSKKFPAGGGGGGESSGKAEKRSIWNLKSPRMKMGGGKTYGRGDERRGEDGSGVWIPSLDSRRRIFPTNHLPEIAISTPPPSPLPLKPHPTSTRSSSPNAHTSTSPSFPSLSISIDCENEYFDFNDVDDDDYIYSNNSDVPILCFPDLSPLSHLARHNPFSVRPANEISPHPKPPKSYNGNDPLKNKEIKGLSTLISPRYDFRSHFPALISPRSSRQSRSTPCSPGRDYDDKPTLPSPSFDFDNSHTLSSSLIHFRQTSTTTPPPSRISDPEKPSSLSIQSDLDNDFSLFSPRSSCPLPSPSTPTLPPPPPRPFDQEACQHTPAATCHVSSNPLSSPALISPRRTQSTVFLSQRKPVERSGRRRLSAELPRGSADMAFDEMSLSDAALQGRASHSAAQSFGARWRPRLAVIGEAEAADGGREGGRARLRLMEAKRRGEKRDE